MGFDVPDEVDWRELDYLKGMCLVSFFELNEEVLRAVVLFRFNSFRADPAFSSPNSFFLFCATLSLEMRDAYSQRGNRPGEPPKALTRAIWSHLEIRGHIEGPPQVAFKKAKPIYDAFARFIAVQVLAGRGAIAQKELDQARTIRKRVEGGGLVLREVSTIRNPLNPRSSDC